MSQNVVAERYALALYELAKEQNNVQKVEDELRAIKKAIQEQPAFITLLTSPNVTIEGKKSMVQEILAKVSPIVLNTIMLLLDRERYDAIADVADSYIELANEDKGIANAKVYSVRPLTATESEMISATFAAKVGKRSLNIENIVDSELLGGLKIQIGNRIYDGSIRGQLDRLARQITT